MKFYNFDIFETFCEHFEYRLQLPAAWKALSDNMFYRSNSIEFM